MTSFSVSIHPGRQKNKQGERSLPDEKRVCLDSSNTHTHTHTHTSLSPPPIQLIQCRDLLT